MKKMNNRIEDRLQKRIDELEKALRMIADQIRWGYLPCTDRTLAEQVDDALKGADHE